MGHFIETERLILRSVDENDLMQINQLVNNKKISEVTRSIPYPSSMDDTKNWFQKQKEECKKGETAVFVIILKKEHKVIGVIGLQINQLNKNAELGYWLGEPFWGKGYMTEAAKAITNFGFDEQKLHRIYAHHMSGNETSGKVLQKIGMQYEGCLKEHLKKNGIFKDMIQYGILRRDYEK